MDLKIHTRISDLNYYCSKNDNLTIFLLLNSSEINYFTFFRSMCSDLVYVILFPQLLMVVHFKEYCNTYGSLAAYIMGFAVRISGGEPLMYLEPFIKFPGWDEENNRQLFPFRTLAMVMSLVTLVGVSWWTKWVFETGRLAPGYDLFHCVVNIPEDIQRVGEPSEEGEQMSMMASGKTYECRISNEVQTVSSSRCYG